MINKECFSFVLLYAVVGCAGHQGISPGVSYKNWPLASVAFSGTTDITSQKNAQIPVRTTYGESPTTDQFILPPAITRGSWNARHPNLSGTFDEADQQVFAESFRTEMERLGLFSRVDTMKTGATNDNVLIRLSFKKTLYLRAAYRYILYLDMQIEGNGVPVRSCRYVADSNEGWSFAKATMSMHQGEKAKARVAETLMTMMIIDLERWLKEKEAKQRSSAKFTQAVCVEG